MHDCDCPLSTTYCDKLNRAMTPAMVKFCKETPSHRSRLHREPIKKVEKKFSTDVFEERFLKIDDINSACYSIMQKLDIGSVSAVLGFPRSGMIPASIISCYLSLPLLTLDDDFNIINMKKGIRPIKDIKGKILVVDDTYTSGRQLKKFRKKVESSDFIFSACFCPEKKLHELDVVGTVHNSGWLLSWNLFSNPTFIEKCAFDLDGIMCPDVTNEIYLDEDRYIKHMSDSKPLYEMTPTIAKCNSIITARLEEYRDLTEEWLNKNNVSYGQLHMYQKDKEYRDSDFINIISKYKSSIFVNSDARIFVESDDLLAKRIAARSKGKRVICPDSGKAYYVKRV